MTTESDRPPHPPRYRLIEYGEPTSLIPPDSVHTQESALLPTGRYAVLGNSDLHIVTMPLQGEPRLAHGRDWTRPTVNERGVPSFMHFGVRCVSSVARAQIEEVLHTRILVDRGGDTLVGAPSASHCVLRPGRSNVRVLEWPIDMFYNPDPNCPNKPDLLTLPMNADEMKEWSFRVVRDEAAA